MLNFESFSLSSELLKAVVDMGFETPTPIQAESIPVLLKEEVDFIGLAQTGTGKTAAYGLPLLNRLDVTDPTTQAIILCPTRELCMQVAEEMQKFARFMNRVTVLAIYGGASIERQITALRKGAQIIVATPGRIIDHLNRGNASLLDIRFLILDEADKMLEMGFKEDIETIMAQTNDEKKVWLFSATMPPEIRRIAANYMNDPIEVTVGRKNTASENVTHVHYLTDGVHRFEVLQRVIDYHPDIYGIIFTRTKNEAQETAEMLVKNGYNADALHGDLAQAQRDRVMKMFREKTLQLLVATDVAARGLDVNDLTHVINYGAPDELDSYIHRVGRTARAGKKGVAITILTYSQRRTLEQLERLIKVKIERSPIPTPQEVIKQRFENYVDNFKEVTFEQDKVAPYAETFRERIAEMSHDELVERLCWMELSRFMDYYKDARDLNRPERPERKREEFGAENRQNREPREFQQRQRGFDRDAGGEGDRYRRFFINVGLRDGMDKIGMLSWLSRATGLPKSHINRVRMNDTYSFFELFADEAHIADRAFADLSYQNRKVRVDPATEDQNNRPREKGGFNGGYENRRNEGGGGYGGGFGQGRDRERSKKKSFTKNW